MLLWNWFHTSWSVGSWVKKIHKPNYLIGWYPFIIHGMLEFQSGSVRRPITTFWRVIKPNLELWICRKNAFFVKIFMYHAYWLVCVCVTVILIIATWTVIKLNLEFENATKLTFLWNSDSAMLYQHIKQFEDIKSKMEENFKCVWCCYSKVHPMCTQVHCSLFKDLTVLS